MSYKRLRHLLCLLFCLIALNGFSQSGIQQAEYFWDTDPGQGNAYAVPAPSGGWDKWLTIFLLSNSNNPTTGTHTLGVRVKDGQGAWGPVYKKVVSFGATRSLKVTAAEYFFNNDPGAGSATPMVAFDGNYNAALEVVFASAPTWPTTLGTYTFGIRIKDESGNWGPLFKKIIAIKNDLRDVKVTAAEYFWDTDPGNGSASSLLVFDGNYDSALETVFSSSASIPSTPGAHTFNIRAKDEAGVWGPVFKKVISNSQSTRNIKVSAGEIFWDNDPGNGAGTPVLAYDGFYSDALETILLSGTTGFPTTGAHIFNVRFRDENNLWGPVFKKVITRQQALRNMKVTAGEYYWDTDPGAGSAYPLIAFDGNFNEALETVVTTSPSLSQFPGDHILGVRIKDESSNWGPVYKKAIRYGGLTRSVQITMAEYFWGSNDPGVGNATPLVAFDGDLNASIENVFGVASNIPETGVNLFNIRIKDGTGSWGPVYKRSVNLAESKRIYITSTNDINSICLGDSLLLKAHGGTGYVWSPLSSVIRNNGDQVWVKPTVSTQYKVKALRNGTWDSAYFNITINQNPVLQVNNPTVSLGSTASMNVFGADVYTWNPEVTFNSASGGSVSVTPPQTTVYNVTGINSTTGCKTTIQSTVTVTAPNYLSTLYPGNQNLLAGEFFWDQDPGTGNGWAIQTIDGNWDQWLERASITDLHAPSDENLHTFNIRIKDRSGNWGNVFKTTVRISSFVLRPFKITNAEYFWNTDPGEGLGTSLIVFDGNYNDAFETIMNDDTAVLNIPTVSGMCQFNIRIKDEKGLWGPVYKRMIAKESVARNFKITSGEYFWDTDPGQGNGVVMVAFDGNFSDAFETVSKRITSLPSGNGAHLFQVRIKDENGIWGPVYKKTIVTLQQLRNIKIASAEYFWDTDPGQGSATALLAFDGNFNQALETVWVNEATALNDTGKHCLNIRIKDENGNWGPLYKRIIMVGYDTRQFIITDAEFFWDTDPGQGLGTPLIVFDGEYNDALETVFKDSVSMPAPYMDHVFNIRIKDEKGAWGPLYKRSFRAGMPTRDIKLTAGEYFFGAQDPGAGRGSVILTYDGYFDKALETLVASNVMSNQSGVQLFNIRVRDEKGNWGPIYKKTINIGSPVPKAIVTASGPLTFCAGDSVILSTTTDTGYTYQWYKDSVAITNATQSSYTVRVSGGYYVVATYSGFSSISQIKNVSVTPLPVATITPAGSLGFCSGGSVVLNATTGSGYTYQWLLNNNLIGSATGASYTASTAGSYLLKVTANGCTASSPAVTVQTGTPITATISAQGPTAFCSGGSVTLSAPTSANYTYRWKRNGTVVSGETASTYLATTSGSYVAEVSNSGCPSNSNTITVTAYTLPTVTISASGSTTFCQGNSINLTANQTTGLVWIPGGQTTTTVSVNSSGNYAVVYTNSNGCVDTSNIIAVNVINTSTVPVASSNSPIINGTTLNLNVATISGATYTWTGPNSFSSTQQNPSIANAQSTANGNYSVYATISGCRTATTTLSVSVLSGVATLIQGNFKTPNGDSIPLVSVRLSGTTTVDSISNAKGKYGIYGVSGGSYTLTPSKNNDVVKANGVSTLDIIKIQSHILNIDTLNSPYKLIAADVNGSGTITNLDILYIRRLILGTDTTFPGNKLWSFVDASYVFPNPYNPFPYPNNRSYTSLTSQTNQHFTGVKLGDVTFDWNKTVLRQHNTADDIVLYADTVSDINSDTIRVLFRVKKMNFITGMQFTLHWDKHYLNLQDISQNRLNIQFGRSYQSNGYLTAIWNEPSNRAVSIQAGEVLFALSFTKSTAFNEQQISMNSEVTPIEAYDTSLVYHNIVLEGGVIKSAHNSNPIADAITNTKIYPNPVSDQLVVDIPSMNDQKIDIQFIDEDGKNLGTKQYSLLKGNNILRIYPKKEFKASKGYYFLRIKGIDFERSFKLLVI